MATSTEFDTKMQQLIDKVRELEERTASFRAFIQPSFDLTEFHQHYDPVTETATAAHDIYHELLHLQPHAH